LAGTGKLKLNRSPGCKVSFMAHSPAFFLIIQPLSHISKINYI
jgi:hypothetical protein